MKILWILLLFSHSLLLYGQDPIYNINKENLHLVNHAIIKCEKISISSDNLYENYKNNNTIFNSVFDLKYNTRSGFSLGFNTTYENRDGLNKCKNFDFIVSYDLYLFCALKTSFAINAGVINNSYYNDNIYNRYSFAVKRNTYDFNKHNFNIGLSSVFYGKSFSFGMAVNHLNKPKLPINPGERIPMKYSAFIRNGFLDKKIITSLVYQFQDEYLYDNIDLDYYYNMLNYLGINIDYNFLMYSIGLGTKHLFNNSNISSLQAGVIFEKIKLYYSSSMFYDKNDNSLFHQFGGYYNVPARPILGRVRVIGCPAF